MRFRTILASLTLAIIAALPMQAQKTTVTGVVQDPNGTAYASGTFNIDFVNGSGCGLPLLQGSPFQLQFTGGLDSSGNLPSMSMADNNQVCAGSQWRFSICSSAGRTCFSTLITITGGSQSVSATLKSAAAILPGVGSATSLISSSANPSTVGAVRLATGDSIGIRNAANSANCLISDTGAAATGNGNLADVLSVGTTSTCGLQAQAYKDFSAAPAQSGVVGVANNVTAVAARNAAGNGDLALIGSNSSNQTTIPNVIAQVNTAGVLQYNGMGALYNVTTDFTTANNTSLQAITGLAWAMPANVAMNVPFQCEISYAQGTANVAVAFGIQDVTTAPTNIFATGLEQTNTTAFTGATLATLSTTTATNIVSATPGATATNFLAKLSGFIEQPSGVASVVQIMVSTAAGADAVTVKRGSFCRLF